MRALRQECHPLLPVRVRMLPGPSAHFAHTALSTEADAFNITVFRSVKAPHEPSRACTRQELVDSLMHEWAHAMAWPGVGDEHALEAHDAAWGVAYARCYQTVVED